MAQAASVVAGVALNPKTLAPSTVTSTKDPAEMFHTALDRALRSVNEFEMESTQAIDDLSSGKAVSLHDTMIAVEKADISQRLFMGVTRRAVEAYKEMMNMQI